MTPDINSEKTLHLKKNYETALKELYDPDKVIDAVYLLEKTAKDGYAPACTAMARLFEEGKLVAKDKKSAMIWYRRAAELGDSDAKKLLAELARKRRRRIIITTAAAVIIAALAAAAVYIFFFSDLLKQSGDLSLKLPPDASMEERADIGDYGVSVNKLAKQYDTEAMRNGDVDTNRILLMYNGNHLDLSAYQVKAAVVSDKLITLQFESAEAAKACFDYLKSLPDTRAVSMDRYEDVSSFTSAAPTASSTGMTTEHSDASGYDYFSWGVRAMGLDEYASYLIKSGLADKKITVAVIDSGFDARDEIINEFGRDRIEAGLNVVTGTACDFDTQGHGTHVGSTILDCTRGLNVVLYPIGLTNEPSGGFSDSNIILGIMEAGEIGADVVNMSLSGACPIASQDLLDEVIHDVTKDKGITFVVAAGNDTVDCEDNRMCPAHIDECITVAAVNRARIPSDFSNFGSCVDIAAPGEEILSFLPFISDPAGYAEWPGTSMASPHVAALAAMIRIEYDLEPKYVEAYVKAIGDGTLTKDGHSYGEGLPDASELVEYIK